MAQIIPRLFSSSTNAAAAVKDVLDYRFGDNEVFTIEGGAKATLDDLKAQIAQAGVAKADAAAYADKVKGGATLIVVHAPFGSAMKATVLLDRHQPLPSPVAAAPAGKPLRYDKATPLSSIYQWPTLSSNPAPFSSFWNLPLLSDYSASRAAGRSELSDNAAPLSNWFKLSTLSDSPTPLSNWFKMPVLKDATTGRNNLMDDPSPLSRWLGLPVISRPSNQGR